jgi:hypothetical protein
MKSIVEVLMSIESEFYWQCLNCRHFKGRMALQEKHRCDAFLDGIPNDIIEGEFDHRRPYPGDNGIRFAWKSKKERVWIY